MLTVPAELRPDAPHVVLLNSGLIHRVGANRVYVAFARSFAAAGIATLRFDLSGIGDSERQDALTGSLQESVAIDIREAVEFLSTTREAKRFVLGGLCSGAFDSFDYALRDPRVSGVVMLDMPGPFRNWSHFAHHLAPRLLRPSSWNNPFKKLTRLSGILVDVLRSKTISGEPLALPGVRGARSRQRMEAELDVLLARNVKLSFIFTGGWSDHYNHRSQFRILFPRAAANPSLWVEFMPGTDHVFSTRNSRVHITTFVRDWLLKQRP